MEERCSRNRGGNTSREESTRCFASLVRGIYVQSTTSRRDRTSNRKNVDVYIHTKKREKRRRRRRGGEGEAEQRERKDGK